jgi:hypothetical protein
MSPQQLLGGWVADLLARPPSFISIASMLVIGATVWTRTEDNAGVLSRSQAADAARIASLEKLYDADSRRIDALSYRESVADETQKTINNSVNSLTKDIGDIKTSMAQLVTELRFVEAPAGGSKMGFASPVPPDGRK